VPPAAGFMGKWQSIVTALPIGGPIVALGIGLLVLNSLLGVGYYVPLIGRLLRRPRGSHPHLAVSMWMQAPIGALALAVLALGLWPGPLLGLTRQAAEFLLSWGVR
jgi:NADH:ubiquinone oxidoreductase subunit 2 (subunit N)